VHLKHLSGLLCLALLPLLLPAQTNTDFWFAGPEATSGHGDQPIYLRLTSFNQTANVTISEPANTPANFPTQNIVILANSTQTVNLTTYKEQIECKPANTILNFGLHIHSDVPITAYYEIAHTNNPEIFTLKGNNAEGTSFFIPSQDTLYNHSPLSPPAYNSFDIVALEDATTVTITTKKAIVGHSAGVPFEVVLNKGQAYSAQATGQQGKDHLMGSTVTSDHAVSITVKDDSDQFPGQGCYDMTGDQIVPVDIIGEEYIVVRGYTSNAVNDWVFVMAVADNTNISVNGTPVATINSGAYYRYRLTSSDLSSFIQADHPVYVYHLTGYGCETGTAILPPMNCTGSTQVAFTRTSQYSFELIILTKDGDQAYFTMDGNPNIVTASMFSAVTGNPTYVYARIDFPVGTLGVGAHILANTQDVFHMGVIMTYDAAQSGCSYGYFSDFASLNLGPDQTVCPGTPVTFDAGPNRQSYDWKYNGAPYASGVQTITVTLPGEYTVVVNDHSCYLYDTVHLINSIAPVPVISGTTEFCAGESHQLSVQSFLSYLWSTGETTESITVSSGGVYSVSVTDNSGCPSNASTNVTIYPLPVPTFTSGENQVCVGTPGHVYTTQAGKSAYTWNVSGGTVTSGGTASDNTATVTWNSTGPQTISVNYTDANGCTGQAPALLNVTVHPLPVPAFTGGDAAACTGTGGHIYTTQAGEANYIWNVSQGNITAGGGTADPTATVTWTSPGPQTITVNYTDANGCTALVPGSFNVTVNPLPSPVISGNSTVCNLSTTVYTTQAGMTFYIWSATGGTITTGGTATDPSAGVTWNTPGTGSVSVNYTDGNGCTATSSTVKNIQVNPLPVPTITGSTSVCAGSSATYNTEPGMTGYSWNVSAGGTIISGMGTQSITVMWNSAGARTVSVNYILGTGCTATSPTVKNITVNALPVPVISGPATPCGLSTATYTVGPPLANYSYLWTVTGGTPVTGTNSSIDVTWGNTNPVSISMQESITYPGAVCASIAPDFPITLVLIPDAAGTISGSSAVCQTLTKTYTIAPINNADGYTWWYVPSTGVSITNNGTSANLLFDLTSSSGNLYVKGNKSGCASGPSSPAYPITINAPPYVALTLCNDSKTTSSSRAFSLKGGVPPGGQYYIDGNLIASGIFDPGTLSTTTHQVTYSYADHNSCVGTSSSVAITIISGSNLSNCTTAFTDPRDNKTYHAALMGTRCWMLDNLSYGNPLTPVAQDQTDNCTPEKYCLATDPSCTTYGGLYQWDELMQYQVPAPGQYIQGLCPPEWHVPTEAEWADLENYYQGPGLAGWSLIDPNPANGFHALTLGILYQNIFWAFTSPGFTASFFWTSTPSPSNSSRVYTHGVNQVNASVSKYFSGRGNAFPVRCVKD